MSNLTREDFKSNPPRRVCDSVQIFPELLPILDAAAADSENDLVMNRRLIVGYGVDANLSTQIHRILERARLKPWPKTFVNLRSTRRTEL